MLKWILGILAVIILLVAGTCWYGYTKIAGAGDSTTVTVAATPELVWQYFTDPDSIAARQDSSATLQFSRDSVLQVGDTIRMISRAPGGRGMAWVLEQREEPTMLVWAARDDSLGHEVIRRIDSLLPAGDSVRIVSRFSSPLLDSLRANDSTSGLSGRLMTGAGRMATGGMRLVAEQELNRLKDRIEQD